MKGYIFVIYFEITDQKDYQCRFIPTAFFGHIYQGYQQFWPHV